MTNYKLSYFDITGLGEPIRFLFAYGGQKFEDHRVKFADWAKIKPEMPLGQMPVLEIDGKRFIQSKAIGRHLARKFNLYGQNEYEHMEVDATIDTIEDVRIALSNYYWEEDAAIKEKQKKTAWSKMPTIMAKLEAQVKENKGFFVNGKVTWPDLYYTAFNEYLTKVVGHDINQDYPELKKLVEKVRAMPKIQEYMKNRPKTDL